jgi:hypothetical protein
LEDHSSVVRSLTPEFEVMAERSLHEFFAPTTDNIHTRHVVNVEDQPFEHKPTLINMMQLVSFVERHTKMQVVIFRFS